MDTIFWICVEIMRELSDLLGISYQAFNVWLFVIVHPIITLYFVYQYLRYKRKYKQCKKDKYEI